jgi:sugar/nucleoside kinase (ribokinase family)
LIQVNELEAKTLFNYEDELQTVREVMKQGTKCFIVTKGDAGARAYFPRDNEIEFVFTPSEKVQTLNKVGCGDIFGAVFFYRYMKNKNVREALMKANSAAGKSASIQDLKELKL